MYIINKAAEAILRSDFDGARELLRNGETLSGSYVENNKQLIIGNIFRNKAFDLVDDLVKNGLIETDVYEYDSFERSVFKNIAQSLDGDDVSITFLTTFLQKISNLNDEVRDQSVIGFCLEQGAAPAIIQCLIDVGCNALFKNNAENNLLHQVINQNMLATEKAIEYIHLLIGAGVEVNDKNITGTTPLLLAVKNRKQDCLELLLQNGANPNERDKQGNTAFYYAVAEQFDPEAFILMNQYASPDFDSRNRDGVSLFCEFMRIMEGGDTEIKLLELLLESGANLAQTSPWYGQPKSGADWLSEKRSFVLQAALAADAIEVNAQDDKGNTLLHKVCGYNVNFDAEAAKELYRKVKLLLEAGADTAITNDKDETPLTLALQDNLKIKTAELLMSRK